TENCPGCSREQSCNACIQNFRNQYAHDLLKRGPVADFLQKALNSLYGGGTDGYIPLGLTDGGRWLEQQLRRATTLNLILDTIPTLSHEHSSGRDSYRVLQDIGLKGAHIRLFLCMDVQTFLHTGSQAKAAFHAITALTQLPNVQIYMLTTRQIVGHNFILRLRLRSLRYVGPQISTHFLKL